MNKKILQILSIAVVSSFIAASEASLPPQQSELQSVLQEPQSQLIQIGSSITFSMNPAGVLSFQWLLGGTPIAGATSDTLTINNAQISDAGFYSCNVLMGGGVLGSLGSDLASLTPVASTTVSLMVFSPDDDLGVVVYAAPITYSGNQGSCPGAYKGYVNYIKTAAQGWGWSPSTNTMIYTAADNTRTNTKVEYVGDYGDSQCATNSVTIPYPAGSTAYRFTIFFTNNVPSTNYPITLTGFNP